MTYFDVGNQRIVTRHCDQVACSTINFNQLQGSVTSVGGPSIAIGSDDLPVISYVSGNNLTVAHCTTVSCSSVGTPVVVDAVAANGTQANTSIAITSRISSGASNGFPVIAYKSTSNTLKVAACGDITCSTGNTITTVDAPGGVNVGDFASLAVGADGFPVIGYQDVTNLDLKGVHCTNVLCSSFDTPATLHSTANSTGWRISTLIGEDGIPVFVHQDLSNATALVSRCTTIACTAVGTTTPSIGFVSAGLSATLGLDGRPVIIFGSNGSNTVAAHCNDATCTGGTATVIWNGSATYSAATIGGDGNPFGFFWVPGSGSSYTVHCSNPNCVPHYRRR